MWSSHHSCRLGRRIPRRVLQLLSRAQSSTARARAVSRLVSPPAPALRHCPWQRPRTVSAAAKVQHDERPPPRPQPGSPGLSENPRRWPPPPPVTTRRDTQPNPDLTTPSHHPPAAERRPFSRPHSRPACPFINTLPRLRPRARPFRARALWFLRPCTSNCPAHQREFCSFFLFLACLIVHIDCCCCYCGIAICLVDAPGRPPPCRDSLTHCLDPDTHTHTHSHVRHVSQHRLPTCSQPPPPLSGGSSIPARPPLSHRPAPPSLAA